MIPIPVLLCITALAGSAAVLTTYYVAYRVRIWRLRRKLRKAFREAPGYP